VLQPGAVHTVLVSALYFLNLVLTLTPARI
jgi:hypothetical protein